MATTGTLVEWLAAGVKTTAGVALASGKVRFNQPGTGTTQPVYSDAACTSAITQPLTLSAGGTGIVYTNAGIRMIVKDATDTTTLFDVTENVQRDDNVFVTSPSFFNNTESTLATILDFWTLSGGGGTNSPWSYKQSGSASERNLKSWFAEVHISVKDFGAVGDGVNNDTTAVQNAINAAGSAGGGIVYFPPGTYAINAALTMGSSGVSLVGAGHFTTIIKSSGGALNAITATSCNGFRIVDLQIAHATTSTAAAIQLASCGVAGTGSVLLDNLLISGYRTGLNLTGTTGALFVRGCNISTPNTNAAERAIEFNSSGSHFFVTNNFLSAGAAGGFGIEFVGSSSTHYILGNSIVGNAAAIRIEGGSFTGNTLVVDQNTLTGTSISFSTNLANLPSKTIFGFNQGMDGKTVDVTTGGTVSPDFSNGRNLRIRGTTTGSAYTVNLPTFGAPTTQRDFFFTVAFFNNAGGAITGWTMNAGYHTSSGPSTTDGQTTTYTFKWDPDSSVYRETSRSVTS